MHKSCSRARLTHTHTQLSRLRCCDAHEAPPLNEYAPGPGLGGCANKRQRRRRGTLESSVPRFLPAVSSFTVEEMKNTTGKNKKDYKNTWTAYKATLEFADNMDPDDCILVDDPPPPPPPCLPRPQIFDPVTSLLSGAKTCLAWL